MPYGRRLNSLIRLLLLMLANSAWQSSFADNAPADDTAKYGRKLNDEERLAALDMLAKALRENYEKIRTWKGEYHFNNGSRFPGEISEKSHGFTYVPSGTPPQFHHGEIPTGPEAGDGHWSFSRGTFQFSLDQTKGKYYIHYDPNEPGGILDIATGREGVSTETGTALHGLMTPEHALTFNSRDAWSITATPDVVAAAMFPEGWSSRIAYRSPSIHGFGIWPLFDTRHFFRLDSSLFLWEFNELRMACLRGERGEQLQEAMNQGLAIYVNNETPPVYTEVYTPRTSGKGSRWFRIYDGKSGFNVIQASRASATDRSDETITYHHTSGVFLPETYDEWGFNLIGEILTPTSHRTFKWPTQEFNIDVPDSDFDIKQFGLKYGDRMVDRIGKDKNGAEIEKLYIYDDLAGFVPVQEFRFDPGRVKDKP